MSQHLITIGIVLIFIGFSLVFIGSLLSSQKSGSKVEWGVGGFIGPIPFGFASSKNMFYITMALIITLFVIFFLLNVVFR